MSDDPLLLVWRSKGSTAILKRSTRRSKNLREKKRVFSLQGEFKFSLGVDGDITEAVELPVNVGKTFAAADLEG